MDAKCQFIAFRRYKRFSILAEDGWMMISAARGRATPEMTSPFDYLTPIWCGSPVGIFCLSLTVQKLFDVFDLHFVPDEKCGEWMSPWEKFFWWDPLKASRAVNPRRLRHEPSKSVEPLDLCTWQRTIKLTKKSQKWHVTYVCAEQFLAVGRQPNYGDLTDIINHSKFRVD